MSASSQDSDEEALEAALMRACVDAFNRHFADINAETRRVQWNAFRSGWLAAELHALRNQRYAFQQGEAQK